MSSSEPVTLRDIQSARQRIASFIYATPLERSDHLSAIAGAPIYLKLECWQRTRSFKIRGAYNAIASMSDAQRRRDLVTASAGNHGQAVALAARELGARAFVYLPQSAPEAKRQRIAEFGAMLCDGGADYDVAERRAYEHAQRERATFVHAFSDPAVVAGQGTVGLEIAEALPTVQTVVVPVGGGGLVGGIGVAVRSTLESVRVVGVQSVETRAMHDSLQAGRVVDVVVTPTLADGLAGGIDQPAFELAQRVIDEMVLVEEAEIAESMRVLQQQCGVMAEGSGAAAVAAVLSGRVRASGPTALVISGGNIDGAKLTKVLSEKS